MYNCLLFVEDTPTLSDYDVDRVWNILNETEGVSGTKVSSPRNGTSVLWYILIDKENNINNQDNTIETLRNKIRELNVNVFIFYTNAPLNYCAYGPTKTLENVSEKINKMRKSVALSNV